MTEQMILDALRAAGECDCPGCVRYYLIKSKGLVARQEAA